MLSLRKSTEFVTNQNQSRIRRSKTNFKPAFFLFLPPSRLNFFPDSLFLSHSSPSVVQWDENGGCGQFITRLLCCFFLLRERGPSPAQKRGQSHETQSSTNFYNMSPSRGLQFFTNCFNMGPNRTTSPTSKPVPAWAPFSRGPKVLPGASSSVGFPQGHSILVDIHLPQHGSLPQTAGGSLHLKGLQGLQAAKCLALCLPLTFTTVCRGISAPAPWAPSSLWYLQSCFPHAFSSLATITSAQ